MTILNRNNFIMGIIYFIFAILILKTVLLFLISIESGNSNLYQIFITPHYILPFFLLVFSVISLFVIRFYFFKTNSPEVFFFIIFLLTFVFDSARTFIYLIDYLNIPFNTVMILSRISYFGKFAGTAALFVSALYSSDFQIRRHGTPLAIISVTSFVLSSSMPLAYDILPNLYLMPGYLNYFIFTIISVQFLAVLIFVIIFFQTKNNEYLLLSLSFILIFAGRELTFYSINIFLFTSGMILLSAGTAFFISKLHYIYSWY